MRVPKLSKENVDFAAQGLAIEIVGGRAEADNAVGELDAVAIDNGEQEGFDFFAQSFVEPADHAAVQDADDAAGKHHEVAGMRIGMIETIAEDHVEVHVGAALGKFTEIEA